MKEVPVLTVELFRPDDSWLIQIVAYPADVGSPKLKRSINVTPFVVATDSDDDIRRKIEALCEQWFECFMNFAEYANTATKWQGSVTVDGEGIPIKIESVDAERITWSYLFDGNWLRSALKFNQCAMALDWIGAKGLTDEAIRHISDAVTCDVERCIKSANPDIRARNDRACRFLATLPTPPFDPVQQLIQNSYVGLRPRSCSP